MCLGLACPDAICCANKVKDGFTDDSLEEYSCALSHQRVSLPGPNDNEFWNCSLT